MCNNLNPFFMHRTKLVNNIFCVQCSAFHNGSPIALVCILADGAAAIGAPHRAKKNDKVSRYVQKICFELWRKWSCYCHQWKWKCLAEYANLVWHRQKKTNCFHSMDFIVVVAENSQCAHCTSTTTLMMVTTTTTIQFEARPTNQPYVSLIYSKMKWNSTEYARLLHAVISICERTHVMHFFSALARERMLESLCIQ